MGLTDTMIDSNGIKKIDMEQFPHLISGPVFKKSVLESCKDLIMSAASLCPAVCMSEMTR